MSVNRTNQTGFTLIEIAMVLLIVMILLGYTVAIFPKQQEVKQYRAAEQEMDAVIEAIIGFAQINGRLPCPAFPTSNGAEEGGGVANCTQYGGFVPVNTIGFSGRINADSLLIDPWGNPYRYYVSSSETSLLAGATGTAGDDFVRSGEMRAVGLVSTILADYMNLDGQFLICDAAGTTTDDVCTGANEVFGNDAGIAGPGPYAGAPFVLISHGKDWNQVAAAGDQLENLGGSDSNADLIMGLGLSGNEYKLKNIAAGETTFVKRPTGFADDFDDIVKWVSPNLLYSSMIEAGQLP